jgi:hypothetical protein
MMAVEIQDPRWMAAVWMRGMLGSSSMVVLRTQGTTQDSPTAGVDYVSTELHVRNSISASAVLLR